MPLSPRFVGFVFCLGAVLAFATVPCLGGATVTQQVSPAEIGLGDDTTITISIQNGTLNALNLPTIDGLQLVATRTATTINIGNGTITRGMAFIFTVTGTRTGFFTIPAFDAQTLEGEKIHVKPINVRVLEQGAVKTPNPALQPTIVTSAPGNAPFNPNGPVTLPPSSPGTPSNGNPASPDDATNSASTGTQIDAPRDPDGGPAKVFIIITPQTTDAYVGQAIPLQIDFFIRMEVNADQNSLPTIKGSDFLMNNFTTRGRVGLGVIQNIQYLRETWMTAISAPKNGDFPLSMERDTYWVKSISNANQNSIFGNFFNPRRNLAHQMVDSNLLTMHIHALPTDGQPEHFTGAIGQLTVTGEATPTAVDVGQPVTLRFTVSGEGNFDYVRCPTVREDPAWKAYIPTSKTSYMDESHTHAQKTFEQSIIPQKNGNLPLPAASFSYFDPASKQYVTVPLALPVIAVTGSAAPIATAPTDSGSDANVPGAAPKAADFLPNRVDIGSIQTSLVPAYRHPWFWAVQTALVSLPLIGALLLFLSSRAKPDDGRAERDLRRLSRQRDEDAMADAVQRRDAVAFFHFARHALQLQLGEQWKLKPEAITLGEIRARDAQLAETLQPLFLQADEVIYSGKASPDLDLAAWDKRVRTELLQPQPVQP